MLFSFTIEGTASCPPATPADWSICSNSAGDTLPSLSVSKASNISCNSRRFRSLIRERPRLDRLDAIARVMPRSNRGEGEKESGEELPKFRLAMFQGISWPWLQEEHRHALVADDWCWNSTANCLALWINVYFHWQVVPMICCTDTTNVTKR